MMFLLLSKMTWNQPPLFPPLTPVLIYLPCKMKVVSNPQAHTFDLHARKYQFFEKNPPYQMF